MKTRFVISKNDIIKAEVCSTSGKFLASINGNNFTRISSVTYALLDKLNRDMYSGEKVEIRIFNMTRELSKYFRKIV